MSFSINRRQLDFSFLSLTVLICVAVDLFISLEPSLWYVSSPFKMVTMILLIVLSYRAYLSVSSLRSLPIQLLFAFSGVCLFYSVTSDFPADSLTRTAKLVFFNVVLMAFYYMVVCYGLNSKSLKKLINICLAMLIVGSILVILNPTAAHLPQSALSYPLLWCLFGGWITYEKGERLTFFLLMVGLITLIFSLKRGPILCIALTSLTWSYVTYGLRFSAANMLRTMVVVILLAVVVFMLISLRGVELNTRLADMTGSGRSITYLLLAVDLLNSSILEAVFGRGMYAVEIFLGNEIGIREGAKYGLMAHNDWLTLAYDFGFVGVAFFVSLHLSVVRTIFRTRSRSRSLYAKLMSVYISFLAVSFFSQILFSTSYIFLSFFLAIVAATEERPHYFSRMQIAQNN